MANLNLVYTKPLYKMMTANTLLTALNGVLDMPINVEIFDLSWKTTTD